MTYSAKVLGGLVWLQIAQLQGGRASGGRTTAGSRDVATPVGRVSQGTVTLIHSQKPYWRVVGEDLLGNIHSPGSHQHQLLPTSPYGGIS